MLCQGKKRTPTVRMWRSVFDKEQLHTYPLNDVGGIFWKDAHEGWKRVCVVKVGELFAGWDGLAGDVVVQLRVFCVVVCCWKYTITWSFCCCLSRGIRTRAIHRWEGSSSWELGAVHSRDTQRTVPREIVQWVLKRVSSFHMGIPSRICGAYYYI